MRARSSVRAAVLAALARALALAGGERDARADSPDPPRAMPDYDNRGPAPTTAGDVALWVPRVVLSPLYVVSEYVVRRPIGWLLTTAEKNQWAAALVDFFEFGPEHKYGVIPTALVDFGFRTSVGAFAFWDDALAPGNHMRLFGSTGGESWIYGGFTDRIDLRPKGTTLDLHIEGTHRPDFVFHGLGPRSLETDRARYGIDRYDGGVAFNTTWWRGSRLKVASGVRGARFRDDACCLDPSVPVSVANGVFPTPPGFDQGYQIGYQGIEFTIDTREARPATQSGFRAEFAGEQGFDLNHSQSNWVRYGATVGGFLDLKDSGRVVSLSVATLFADPLTGNEIPFTEQVVLGGSGPMRGYRYGRLVDRSAAIATLKYRWPIWVFLDGSAQLATGNVFGPQLGNFDPKLLRLSGALGIETVGAVDHTFEFLVGFGTETFDDKAKVDSFRLVFGTNKGF